MTDGQKQFSDSLGRPLYDPKGLLKMYVYGSDNGIKSLRKLAKSCKVNVKSEGCLAEWGFTSIDGRKLTDRRILRIFQNSWRESLLKRSYRKHGNALKSMRDIRESWKRTASPRCPWLMPKQSWWKVKTALWWFIISDRSPFRNTSYKWFPDDQLGEGSWIAGFHTWRSQRRIRRDYKDRGRQRLWKWRG